MKTSKIVIIGVITLVLLCVIALIIPISVTINNQITQATASIIKSNGINSANSIGARLSEKFNMSQQMNGVIQEYIDKKGNEFKFQDMIDLNFAYLNNDPDMETAGYWSAVETTSFENTQVEMFLKDGAKMLDHITPYAYRNGKKNELSVTFIDISDADWYNGAYDSLKPHISDPYIYEGVFLMSMSTPLYKNGKVIGVTGADLDITSLNNIVKKINYQGEGSARLISNNYILVADSKNPDLSGTSLSSDQAIHKIFESIIKGEVVAGFIAASGEHERMYRISLPIKIGNSDIYWMLELSLPQHVIDNNVNKSLLGVYITAIIVLIFAVVVAILFSIYIGRAINARDHWYRQILDTIPAPLSVIAMDMKLQYVNKVSRDVMKVNETEYIGKDCGTTWNTEICDKSKNRCPIMNLQTNGTKLTLSKFMGMSWEIHTDYILNTKGKKVGMIEFLNDITAKDKVEHLVETAGSMIKNVQQSSSQISSASESLSQGATEQAASLEQITSSVSQSAHQVSTNASNADEANKIAQNAHNMARDGREKMESLENSMQGITENANLTRNVIKTIDDIAFQTNLLALNAAVEAARAGIHGKGFAVVAEEVRNLAARSAKAAQETADLIDKSNDEIVQGAKLSKDTAEALSGIAEESAKVESLIAEIATASKDQSEGIMQINTGLEQIDKVTHHNTATAEETASTASELNKQITDLAHILSDDHVSLPQKKSTKKAKRVTPLNSQKIFPANKTPKEWGGDVVQPTDQINLDDTEFGKF